MKYKENDLKGGAVALDTLFRVRLQLLFNVYVDNRRWYFLTKALTIFLLCVAIDKIP